MYLLCTTTALIYYCVLSVHLLSVVRLYSRSSPASLLVCFGSLFSQFQAFLIIFALAFLFRSSRLISLSLSPSLPPVVSHGRRGFPQAHSVRLAYHEEREEETKERIEFRFAVEAVAVTRSKRRNKISPTQSELDSRSNK